MYLVTVFEGQTLIDIIGCVDLISCVKSCHIYQCIDECLTNKPVDVVHKPFRILDLQKISVFLQNLGYPQILLLMYFSLLV